MAQLFSIQIRELGSLTGVVMGSPKPGGGSTRGGWRYKKVLCVFPVMCGRYQRETCSLRKQREVKWRDETVAPLQENAVNPDKWLEAAVTRTNIITMARR